MTYIFTCVIHTLSIAIHTYTLHTSFNLFIENVIYVLFVSILKFNQFQMIGFLFYFLYVINSAMYIYAFKRQINVKCRMIKRRTY